MRIKPCWCSLLFLLLCCVYAHAQPPAERFAGRIADYKQGAASTRIALADVMGQLEQLPAMIKLDSQLITEHFEEIAQTWEEAAAVLEKGEETAGTALAARAQELLNRKERWEQRLHWRRLQSQNEYLPATAEIYFLLAAEHRGDLAGEVDAWLEAKKVRSEAYGRLAEATTPSADQQALQKLKAEAFALDVAVGVAEMKYTWARDDWNFRTWVATDTKVDSPELRQAKERLAQLRQQREQTYQQSRNLQFALEQLERDNADAVAAGEKAYRAAKAAQKPPNSKK